MTAASTTATALLDPRTCPYGWIEVAARNKAGADVDADDAVVALESILAKVNGKVQPTGAVKVTFKTKKRPRFEVMTSRAEAADARKLWSATTSICGDCLGSGETVAGVSVASGTAKITCRTCGGTTATFKIGA